MDMQAGALAPDANGLRFTGRASDFVEVWAKNLVFNMLTLGFYRFWAKTNVRRYLWANTRLWGEPMEYTGTGLELFLGFLVALVVFVIPFSALNIFSQLYMQSDAALAITLVVLSYLYLFILGSFAMYRMQRYRLTRTLWRGIRGGMAHAGFAYGLKAAGLYLLAMLSLGLAGPWVSARVWNLRWTDSSFGSQAFEADASPAPLYKIWFITVGIVLGAGVIIAAIYWKPIIAAFEPGQNAADPTAGLAIIGWVLLFYLALGIAFLVYQARYWQVMIGATRWGAAQAQFTASPWHWVLLMLKTVAIVIFSFGIASGWVPYITWKFWTRHMVINGAPDLDALMQSETQEPGRGEGLADALDMGAF